MRGIEQYLQVDAATLGALKYAGTWNASTNTPTLASGVGTQGQYYVVSVAGSTNLDGETNWQVGDWAVFNGSVWQKVDGGSTGLLSTLTVTGNTYLATTSGNVGIGTTSPANQFNMYNATNATATIQGDAIVTLAIERYSTNSIAPSFAIRKFRGTLAAPTAVATGDVIANLNFVAYGGTTQRVVSQVRSFVDTYVSDTDISSYLTFSTSPAGSAAATEQMRITSAGNVGIATTSPDAKLRVNGTAKIGEGAASNTSKLMVNTVSGVAAGIQLFQDANESWIIQNPASTTALTFANSGTERMRITATGDVGIGTSSPGSRLTVAGNVEIRGGAGTFFGDATNATFPSIKSPALNTIGFFLNSGAETARIDSSGNFGIGTSSPARKLTVQTTDASTNSRFIVAQLNRATSGTAASGIGGWLQLQAQDDAGAQREAAIIGWDLSDASSSAPKGRLYLGTRGANDAVVIDNSGNLGLGVTPSAWSGIKALEFGGGNFIASNGGNGVWQGNNCYYNGANWIYKATAAASYSNQVLGAHAWFNAPSGTAGNAISFTQAMTLDASGNLGIGTTPSYKLDVQTSAGRFQVQDFGAGSVLLYSNGALAYNAATTGHQWQLNGSEQMRLDSSGNLGLGVVPSAWSGVGKTLQIGTGGSFSADAANAYFAANAYYNGTNWIYQTTNNSARYNMTGSGQHQWFNAASGTAGNAISFTQAMTLDASGNLGVGSTAPVGYSGYSGITVQNTNGGFINLRNGASTNIMEIAVDAANTGYVKTVTSTPLIFGTNNAERMRITSAGNIHTPAGATTMTNGFFYIPAAAGVPTGVPTAITGTVPMYYDTTNNKFYVYNGAWKSVALL